MPTDDDIRPKLRIVRGNDGLTPRSIVQDTPVHLPGQFRNLFDLTDKVALVIGGGGGLGSAIACGLADFGAQVMVADLDIEAAERTANRCDRDGRPAMALEIDVTDPESIEGVIDEVAESAEKLDILVNAAGINIRKPAIEYTPGEWWRVVNTNLSGVFFATQAAGRQMLPRGYGRILSIGSVSSLLGHPYHAPYAATKGGIAIMTKSFATEWAPHGITVNALGPAYTETGLTRAFLGDDERRQKITATIPMGRLGTPEDLVGAAVFLCSDAASFVTGQTLYVDGGRTAD
ncbi:MAG: glucose 1-dehydrogenase [Thermomicrobiales bacterium]|jgi:NAD(P)-dependent dehydrogenase (short-subunit alcohol dehydrogenase family)|nr:glucose 1-dehydrogenase [Thermomicrobiales bacterium]